MTQLATVSIGTNGINQQHGTPDTIILMPPYTLYGWKLSYFTGKLYSYLKCKNIPFVENNVNIYTLYSKVKKNTGAVVMPTLTTPEGEWLQDTRNIINILEKRFPDSPSVFPTTPKRLFVSNLFEAWGDEMWISTAMHYRWNYPESVEQFKREAGDSLLPFAPRMLKNHFANKTATTLIQYLPYVGVTPDQFPILEKWTVDMLSKLDVHFKDNRYLLGNDQPTIGDFGMMGPLYAHLSRDPWPRDHLMNEYPHLKAWIDRMLQSGDATDVSPDNGEGVGGGDEIPPTLVPILRLIFNEFTPMAERTLEQLNKLLAEWPEGKILRRTLYRDVPIQFPMGDALFSRPCNPHLLYKVQGVLDGYRQGSYDDQVSVEKWVEALGGKNMLSLDIPRLERVALQVRVVGQGDDRGRKKTTEE